MKGVKTFYFDTSALLPYYREEAVSGEIEKLLLSITPPVFISDLTRVEFASALSRWVRMGELTEAQANLVENILLQDIQSKLLISLSLSPMHYRQAKRWLSSRKTLLRTLDALQLACSLHHDSMMVTCDKILHQAATLLGVPCMFIGSPTN